jgi:hypothetical protein
MQQLAILLDVAAINFILGIEYNMKHACAIAIISMYAS